MRAVAPLSRLEEKIGYTFQNPQLLEWAFTHSTYRETYGGGDNERMEYLGDAVLQLVVSKKQFLSPDKKDEGEMTKERQTLVCQSALLKQAEELGLEKYLLFVGSQSNVGAKTISSLYETLVAAIYLDGGLDAAEAFIERFYPVSEQEINYIGKLQEFVQRKGADLPVYSAAEKTGEDHKPTFRVTVSALGIVMEGTGGSYSKARQQAAKNLYERLNKKTKRTNL